MNYRFFLSLRSILISFSLSLATSAIPAAAEPFIRDLEGNLLIQDKNDRWYVLSHLIKDEDTHETSIFLYRVSHPFKQLPPQLKTEANFYHSYLLSVFNQEKKYTFSRKWPQRPHTYRFSVLINTSPHQSFDDHHVFINLIG